MKETNLGTGSIKKTVWLIEGLIMGLFILTLWGSVAVLTHEYTLTVPATVVTNHSMLISRAHFYELPSEEVLYVERPEKLEVQVLSKAQYDSESLIVHTVGSLEGLQEEGIRVYVRTVPVWRFFLKEQ